MFEHRFQKYHKHSARFDFYVSFRRKMFLDQNQCCARHLAVTTALHFKRVEHQIAYRFGAISNDNSKRQPKP